MIYDCSSSQIGGLNTAHLFLKIFHVLLVDVVVLVSWELVDPLQSETIKISEEVRKKMKGVFLKRVQEKIGNGHFSFASNIIFFVAQYVGLIHLRIKQEQNEGKFVKMTILPL